MEKDKEKDKDTLKFDLRKYCKLCLRHWLWFAACLAFCLMLAGVIAYRKLPKTEVVASLKLPPESNAGGIMAISDLASSFSLGDMFGGSSTDNEVAMMSSHAVFMKTVKDLGLNVACYEKLGPMKWAPVYDENIPISVIPANAESNDTISRTVIFKVGVNADGTFDVSAKIKKKTIFKKQGTGLPCEVSTPVGAFAVDTTAAFAKRNPKVKVYRLTFASYNSASQGVARTVRAYAPDKKTDFIALSYVTSDPNHGELLLNTIIDNYNLVCNEQRNEQDSNTLGFVDKRLASLEEELARTEERMETFKKENNLTDVEVDAATLLTTSSELDRAQLLARVECEALKMAKEFIANQENKYSLIPSLGSGEGAVGPAAAIEQYNQLIIQRMRLLDSTTPNNTSLKRLDSEIDAMRASVIESLDRAYEQSKIKLDEITSKGASMTSRLGTLPTLEREYIGIERDLVLQQQLYLFLLKQREETMMSLSQATPSLITVDAPYPLTEPAGLSTKIMLAFALLMGFLIPMALLYFLRYKKAPLTANDIETIAQAPVIGIIKKDGSNDALPVLESKGGESIRQLRAEVLRILDGLGPDKKTAMVASPYDGEGKTYLATNLAASIALLGKKVLLVEADLSNGNQPLMGYELSAGLADLSDKPLAECVQSINYNGWLTLLGPGNVGDCNGDDVVGHCEIQDAILKANEDYEYIVIDTASYASHSGAFELASLADLTLCPVAVGRSTVESVEQADALCQDGRLPRVAIVVNMA